MQIQVKYLLLLLFTSPAFAASFQCVVEERPACGSINIQIPQQDAELTNTMGGCQNYLLITRRNTANGATVDVTFLELNKQGAVTASEQTTVSATVKQFSVNSANAKLLCANIEP